MPAAAQRSTPHPPLAHDSRGVPIQVPDTTIAWRVRRQTAGRPKVVLGPDRQALRLPLETSAADLLDLCGAGTYRLDAVDDGGQLIDFVTTVTVGADSHADASDADSLPSVLPIRSGSSSDLRFALETIAHLARANSEALRSTTAAQADWIKGLAQAKALHRNAVVFASPNPPRSEDEEEDSDDEDQDDEDDEGSDD